MVPFFLVVAVLNLGLGFAAAVYLGHRQRLALESTIALSPAVGPAVAAPPVEPAPPTASAESVAASPIPADPALDPLQLEVARYHVELVKADDALRGFGEAPDATAVKECLDGLQTATKSYLEQWAALHGVFEDRHHDRPEMAAVRGRMEAAVQQQDSQIQTSYAAIQAVDYDQDLAKYCRDMVLQTSRLMDSNHCLRDTLDDIGSVLCPESHGAGPARPEQGPPSGVASRVDAETFLRDWWARDPQRVRPLSAAMLDVDRFSQINQQFGYRTGDDVLHALGQLLRAECRSDVVLARLSGQRFLLLFPDADLRAAVDTVERVRQTVALAHFWRGETEIRAMLSAGAVEATAVDTSDSLLSRADATLREAKRYGRNRTFLHEGKYPAPVVPPSLTITDKQITL